MGSNKCYAQMLLNRDEHKSEQDLSPPNPGGAYGSSISKPSLIAISSAMSVTKQLVLPQCIMLLAAGAFCEKA
jgi:hypothetical protein